MLSSLSYLDYKKPAFLFQKTSFIPAVPLLFIHLSQDEPHKCNLHFSAITGGPVAALCKPAGFAFGAPLRSHLPCILPYPSQHREFSVMFRSMYSLRHCVSFLHKIRLTYPHWDVKTSQVFYEFLSCPVKMPGLPNPEPSFFWGRVPAPALSPFLSRWLLIFDTHSSYKICHVPILL